MNLFTSTTSNNQKKELDKAVAKFFYATNTPFNRVEHPTFKALMRALRPSYSPPSRKDLSGPLLEEVHALCEKEAADLLENKLVTLNLDGWSNVNEEPIICVSASTTIGDVFLLDTIETGANPHDANYLQQIAQETIKKSEEKFKFKVCGFVTYNASNVSKMRKQMEQNEDTGDIFFYGCSAHLLNLLAGDLKIPNVVDRVKSVVKYFKFTHKPHGWLKEKGSNKMKLPTDVRWNSVCDTLNSYLNCWPTLLSIVEEHRSEIKPEIYRTITDISLTRNVEDYVKLLKPVAIALDSVQTAGINLSDSVAAWLKVGEELNEHLSTDKQAAFRKRMESAVTPLHLLSYCLDPRFAEESSTKLSRDLAAKAVNYAATVSDKLVPVIAKFRVRSPPFDSPYMSEATRKSMMPADWWKLLDVEKDVLETIQCILSCSPSTADLERIFSTYSWVHSKERNRLGVEKSAKLVFVLKTLNMSR